VFTIFDAAVGVAYHLVTGLTSALTPLMGSMSAAVAIVVFTACVRLALHPLSRHQAAAGRAREALAPKVSELRDRHRDDPLRAHREVNAVYQEAGTSAFAGIGAGLLQLPFFSVVYRLFLSPAIGGHANLLLAHTLLGVPLGSRWLFAAGAFGPHGLVFLGLFVLLGVVAWWSSRLSAPAPGALGVVMRLLPFGTIAAAAYLPLAAGLYLLTTTTWSAAERTLLWNRPAAA
jgi:YidC/Oxa1 family membrane protein insertase